MSWVDVWKGEIRIYSHIYFYIYFFGIWTQVTRISERFLTSSSAWLTEDCQQLVPGRVSCLHSQKVSFLKDAWNGSGGAAAVDVDVSAERNFKEEKLIKIYAVECGISLCVCVFNHV